MMDGTELGCGSGSEDVQDGITRAEIQPMSEQMEVSQGATAVQENVSLSTIPDAAAVEEPTNGSLEKPLMGSSATDAFNEVDQSQAMSDIEHVSREALDGVQEAADASPNEELMRLRNLVFASRGTKSQLPQGWENEGDGEIANEEASSQPNDMVDRAVASVGEQIADESEQEEEDSSEESSSESSSSDSEAEAETNGKPKVGIVNYASDEDEDEEGGKAGTSGRGPTTKNEVLEATVDVPPYSVVPSDKDIRPLGKVHSIVDSVVVVAQETGKAPGVESAGYASAAPPIDSQGRRGEQAGEYSVLDTGSLLTFDDRKVLGVVYETFGSVLEPLYALRFSSAEHVNANVIFVGKPVFYVPADSTYVLTRALRAMAKGSDASNVWDEEVGDEERDFSDDEAEAEYKRNLKASKRQDGGPVSGPSAGRSGGVGGTRRGGGGGGGTRPAVALAGQWQHQQQQHSPYATSMAPHYAMSAPVMHPDVDLGIARSAPLPYDDESANAGIGGAGGVRYSPYQHLRPTGGSAQTHVGGMARGRGRGHFSQARNYGGHAAVNPPPFAAASHGQHDVYGQINPYAAYSQQQAYGTTPATPNTFHHYPYGNTAAGYGAVQQQQAPFNYAPNSIQSYDGGQATPTTHQGPEQKSHADGVYDPAQPHY